MPRTRKPDSVIARLIAASQAYSEALEEALRATKNGALSGAEKRQVELLRPLLQGTKPETRVRQDSQRQASSEAGVPREQGR